MELNTVLLEECSGMTHAEAFAHVKSKTMLVDGMAQSGIVLAYIASIGRLNTLRQIAMNPQHPLQDAADATIVTLETREGFNFASPATLGLMQAFVTAEIITEEQSLTIRGIGKKEVLAFPSVNILEVVQLRNPSDAIESISDSLNSSELTINRAHDITMNVVGELPITHHVVLQSRDKYGESWGQWRHVTTIPNVNISGHYTVRVDREFFKSNTEFRTVCQFTTNMSLTATVV